MKSNCTDSRWAFTPRSRYDGPSNHTGGGALRPTVPEYVGGSSPSAGPSQYGTSLRRASSMPSVRPAA